MAGSITYNGTTYHAISLKGQVQRPRLAVEDVSRAGVDGTEWRELHTRGEPFEMTLVRDCDNVAAAVVSSRDLQALQGRVVSVTDDYGTTQGSVMCVRAEQADVRALVVSTPVVSTFGKALLTMRFTFISTAAT